MKLQTLQGLVLICLMTASTSAPADKKKLLELLKHEGKPGWKKESEELDKEKVKEMNAQNGDTSTYEVQDADVASPQQLITSIETKLSKFNGPLKDRVKDSLSNLNKNWNGMSDDDRLGAIYTLDTVFANIDKFGNAGNDPVGAIKAGIDIISAITSNFGPKGQMVSFGLSFVSGLLGLFGNGPEPKPLAQVVREQIDEALSIYRDEDLTSKAQGLVRTFQESKAYLDGAASSGELLSEKEMQLAAIRVPISQGAEFLGELATVILKMFSENKVADARKCIKYCELYAELAVIRDMILTQFISMSSNAPNLQKDIKGMIAHRQNFRDGTKALLEKLYTVDYDSNILPYFDPDVSVITDTYSTKMLNLGKYDRSMAGLYCLMTKVGKNGFEDLDWSTKYDSATSKLNGNPYTTSKKHSGNANCYWKLVPHGKDIYSIVNRYKCNEGDSKCNMLLSWTTAINKIAFADIATDDPCLWEIKGGDMKYIRNKSGCGKNKGKLKCDYDLRIKDSALVSDFFPLQTGMLAAKDGKNYWKLQKKA